MSNLMEVDKVENLEFKWDKKRGVGGKKKEVQFYESFIYDGVDYALHDCVYMYKEGEPEPYIGKLVKIWEHQDNKTKKVKVHWFFHPSEIRNWLEDEEAIENEIFLAAGEGVGVANVNPLEAIAGKCNVVCISKDSRNPQPSEQELQMADHVFYRTFDVRHCTISDKMDDKVAGLEVKFVFNSKEGENISGVPKLDSDKKKEPEEFKIARTDGNSNHLVERGSEDVKDLLVSGGKPASGAALDSNEMATTSGRQGTLSGDKTTKYGVDSDKNKITISKVRVDHLEDKVKLDKDSGALENKPSKKLTADGSVKFSEKMNINNKVTLQGNDGKALATTSTSSDHVEDKVKIAKDSGVLENKPSKKSTGDGSVKFSEKTNINSKATLEGNDGKALATTSTPDHVEDKVKIAKDSGALENKPSKKSTADGSVKLSERTNINSKVTVTVHGNDGKALATTSTPSDHVEDNVKSAKDSGALENKPSKKSTADGSVKLSEKTNINSKVTVTVHGNDVEALATTSTPSEMKPKTGSPKDFLGSDRGVKSAKDTGALDDRPSKKARIDSSIKSSENKNNNGVQKLSIKTDGNKGKELAATLTYKGKRKSEAASLGPDKDPMHKSDEQMTKLSNGNLIKVSARNSHVEDQKTDADAFEVTRRPDDERSKWFRDLPWEERMKSAQEQGTLVQLLNLDPEYTSGEVEDIIWHAFKETCTAKMVPRTAISSPHSGQAFIVLKTRGAAERIVKELHDRCLMLSNRSPLVGSSAPPHSVENKSAFVGHLSVENIKQQTQREMKEAVSTSHCSQPNTIEYEMAMEWCLLQSRSEHWWKQFYKQQGVEVRKLKASLKLK